MKRKETNEKFQNFTLHNVKKEEEIYLKGNTKFQQTFQKNLFPKRETREEGKYNIPSIIETKGDTLFMQGEKEVLKIIYVH